LRADGSGVTTLRRIRPLHAARCCLATAANCRSAPSWHHRTPSVPSAASTVRAAERSRDHAVFRRESFTCLPAVEPGSRPAPTPRAFQLEGPPTWLQALTSSVARAAGGENSTFASRQQPSPCGGVPRHCPRQGRSSRTPVKTCEPLDPERLRLASSQPSGRKWSPGCSTRAVLPGIRNTLSQTRATRPSRLWVAFARYLSSCPTTP
jgi:hypothetical protein